MRTFEGFPEEATCPVCGKNTDKECVLISIQGTGKGNICEAAPVHVDCIQPEIMTFNKEFKIIYFMADKQEDN